MSLWPWRRPSPYHAQPDIERDAGRTLGMLQAVTQQLRTAVEHLEEVEHQVEDLEQGGGDQGTTE